MAPVEASTATAADITFRYGGCEGKGSGKGVGSDGRRGMKQPRGIRLREDGALLVADFGNHCVYRFAAGADPKGRVVAGEEGKVLPTVDPLKDIDRPLQPPEGEGFRLKQPVDAAFATDGGVLVLDAEENRVQHFTGRKNAGPAALVVPPPGSTAKKSVHQPEALKYPRHILPQEDGSTVVCDTWSHRVLRFPAPDADEALEKPTVLAGSPNSWGPVPEKLAFPSCAIFAPDGALLVADTNNHRVQRFPPGSEGAGVKAETIAGSSKGESGNGVGQLNMPTGLCIDPRDGSLLVTDRMNGRVLRFRKGSRGGDAGEVVIGSDLLKKPWGICMGADGSIYVSDERAGVVLRIGGASVGPVPGSAVDEEEEEPADSAPAQVEEQRPPAVQEVEAATAPPVAEVPAVAPPVSLKLNEDPSALD